MKSFWQSKVHRSLVLSGLFVTLAASLVSQPAEAKFKWPYIAAKPGRIQIGHSANGGVNVGQWGRSIGNSIEQNAKGLDRAIKRNTQTLSHLGRAIGCYYTACLSEAYRWYKDEEARKKSKRELNHQLALLRAEFDNLTAADKKAAVSETLKKLANLIALNEGAIAIEDEVEIGGKALLESLEAETEFRKSMKQQVAAGQAVGEPDPALVNRWSPSVQKFQTEMRAKNGEAFSHLNSVAQQQAEASGMSHAQVLSEMISLFSDDVLNELHDQVYTSLFNSQKRANELRNELMELNSIRAANEAILKTLP